MKHWEEEEYIRLIVRRAAEIIGKQNDRFMDYIGGEITMIDCLRQVHRINPIKLEIMYRDATQEDILHDVLGCIQHYDWVEDKLTDCFLPRYSA